MPSSFSDSQPTVAVIGLGYVGLPLAVEFGKKVCTLGVDSSAWKIDNLRRGIDTCSLVEPGELESACLLQFYTDPSVIKEADFVVIAVPTPVDINHQPDFRYLRSSSEAVGGNLKRGAVVVYESTVYPGATEEVCIPILEEFSGLKWQSDFWVGYSPERINPGDSLRTLTKVVKVVSGDTPETLEKVSRLYRSIVAAGVYEAPSIKVAEAAKVIENTQRDLNIALMNELAIIFQLVGVDTSEVLEAAGTKWNFLNFRPGLVGGHCIGVDPYYLTYKAASLGYNPKVILSGRTINDGMASYIAKQIVKQMIFAGVSIVDSKVIILGVTFKENCPDLRNSKVADLYRELVDFGCDVYVHDPLADPNLSLNEYGIRLVDWGSLPTESDAIVAAVAHSEYLRRPLADLLSYLKAGGIFADIKSSYGREVVELFGRNYWRL